MSLKICSWNINSVRLRAQTVADFLEKNTPDLLALQEIKCQTHEFPKHVFSEIGYDYSYISGQKSWHGVALIAKRPMDILATPDFCRRGEARVQAIKLDGITLWNLYIPAGGDIADREESEKFDHKLTFYERLILALKAWPESEPLILLGDFNIAPGENDVWNHKYMLKFVSHTPIELLIFDEMIKTCGLIDPFRISFPEPQKIFSWWSYRAKDYQASNRGLRLDHILLNPAAAKRFAHHTPIIHEQERAKPLPSDHVPISLELKL